MNWIFPNLIWISYYNMLFAFLCYLLLCLFIGLLSSVNNFELCWPARCYTDELWLTDELKWVWHSCCDIFQLVPSAVWVSCLHWGGSCLRPAVSKLCLMALSVHITPTVAGQILEEALSVYCEATFMDGFQCI